MVRSMLGMAAVAVLLCAIGASYEVLAERRDLAAAPPPGRSIDIGGRRLHLWCIGTGAPTVVFDSAFGGTTLDWHRVMPEVGSFTTACAYDRAGMGYSDAGPRPVTAQRMADDLDELLRRSGNNNPVVLVGWSWSGLYVRTYATQHEAHVAALVLVDTSHEEQIDRFRAAGVHANAPFLVHFLPLAQAVGLLRLVPNPFVERLDSVPEQYRRNVQVMNYRADKFRTMRDEENHQPEIANEVRSSRRVLSMPIVILTARQGPYRDIWLPLQHDLLGLSPRSCQTIVADSTHMMPDDAPDAIVRGVRIAIEAWRSASAPACS